MTTRLPARAVTAAAALLASLALGACAGGGAERAHELSLSAAKPTPPSSSPALRGELVVLAAASLADPFTELGARLEARHPELTVTFSFGGSSGLAEQIVSGAPVDVFASASTSTMQRAVQGLREARVEGAEGLDPAVFARNSMVLAVPRANRARVEGLTDLSREDVMFALCEEQVPCGAAASRVLESAGITGEPVTLERDVTAVLVKVRADEVDAGIVYATDIDESVTGIAIPAELNSTTSYPILALPQAPHPEAAAAFTSLVLSPEGLEVLARHGFAAP